MFTPGHIAERNVSALPPATNSLNIQGLFAVAPSIKETLQEAEQILNALEDDQMIDLLPNVALHKLYETAQVCEFLELVALGHLAKELAYGFEKIIYEKDFDNIQELKPALIEGFVIFNRYLEFVLLQERIFDHVLLTTINRLRAFRKLPALFGMEFLISSQNARDRIKQIALPLSQKVIEDQSIIITLSQTHKSYRLQLFRLLNAAPYTHQWQGALITLTQAIQNILKIVTNTCQEPIWQFLLWAITANTPQEQNDLMLACLYPALMRSERLLAHPQEPVDFHLLMDSFSLALLRQNPKAIELRKKYSLEHLLPSQKMLEKLKQAFFGPNAYTANQIGEILLGEIEKIKHQLSDHFTSTEKSILNERLKLLVQTLFMLMMDGAAKDLQNFLLFHTDMINMPAENLTPELKTVLLEQMHKTENSVMLYQLSYIPGTTVLPLHNFRISIKTLEQGRDILLKESRKLFAVVRENIHSCYNSLVLHPKSSLQAELEASLPPEEAMPFNLPDHMLETAGLLKELGGVMAFMFVDNGHYIACNWSRLIQDHIKQGRPITPSFLYNLAVSITPLEMYFEHLEQKRPPRLELIEQSASNFSYLSSPLAA